MKSKDSLALEGNRQALAQRSEIRWSCNCLCSQLGLKPEWWALWTGPSHSPPAPIKPNQPASDASSENLESCAPLSQALINYTNFWVSDYLFLCPTRTWTSQWQTLYWISFWSPLLWHMMRAQRIFIVSFQERGLGPASFFSTSLPNSATRVLKPNTQGRTLMSTIFSPHSLVNTQHPSSPTGFLPSMPKVLNSDK